MIPLRDVLVRPGVIDSERVIALPVTCQLFFRNLLHCCDGAGIFPADVAELRAAFYWRSPGVSNPHVETWLTKCHQAGLVKLYTRGGKPYGELINYGQRDTKRRKLYPGPDDGELNFAAPPGDPPKPRPAASELNRRESPQPPAERGAGKSLFPLVSQSQAAAVEYRKAKRLETLQGELERIEGEMRDILRPGGCAYNIQPTGEKATRLERLTAARLEIKQRIAEREAAA